MKQEDINKAARLHVAVVLGEEQVRSCTAFPLREKMKEAFVSGVSWCQGQFELERNKIVFDFDPEKIEIELGQSPRGIRIRDKRAVKIVFDIHDTFDRLQLKKFQEYLTDLISAMDAKGEIKP